MGTPLDYVRLASEVLGIRNAPPELAKRLVEQALVVEDRRDDWLPRANASARGAGHARRVRPAGRGRPRALVGKADNMQAAAAHAFRGAPLAALEAGVHACRRRGMGGGRIGDRGAAARSGVDSRARAAGQCAGRPRRSSTRAPCPRRCCATRSSCCRPASADSVELLGVRANGAVLMLRARRDGTGLAARVTALREFFAGGPRDAAPEEARALDGFAPLVLLVARGRGEGPRASIRTMPGPRANSSAG